MKKVFEVEVYETYCKKVKVIAEDEQEACDLASEEEINMTWDDYVSDTTEYGTVKETDEDVEDLERANKLWRPHFEYLRDDECLTNLVDMMWGRIWIARHIMSEISNEELLEIYGDM